MNQKLFSFLVVIILFQGAGAPLLADGDSLAWTQKDEGKFQKRLEKLCQRRLKFVTRELNLSPEQKTALDAVLRERNERLFVQEKRFRAEKLALKNEMEEKIISILTPQQKNLYENGEGQKGGSFLHDQQPGRYRGGGLNEERDYLK